MKITKERGILCALMAAGLVALAVDRLAASPSQLAAGAPILETAAPQAAASPVHPSAPLPASLVLARQLRSASGAFGSPRKSAFLVSGGWDGVEAPQPIVPVESAVTRFLQTHRLEGVLQSDRGGNAIINGNTVAPGQTLDGFRLVSVDRNVALLEYGAVRVNLKLDLREGQKGIVSIQ
jgi:hypothetical protein